jgi:ribonuclease VapC
MIAVDTSALMAVLLGEANADRCVDLLERETQVLISAGTMAEALIVADRRNVGPEMRSLIDDLGMEIAAVTASDARRVAEAYGRWGKGAHRAGLNFGDCFAYVLAKQRSCTLLFVGDDFARTDVEGALTGP